MFRNWNENFLASPSPDRVHLLLEEKEEEKRRRGGEGSAVLTVQKLGSLVAFLSVSLLFA